MKAPDNHRYRCMRWLFTSSPSVRNLRTLLYLLWARLEMNVILPPCSNANRKIKLGNRGWEGERAERRKSSRKETFITLQNCKKKTEREGKQRGGTDEGNTLCKGAEAHAALSHPIRTFCTISAQPSRESRGQGEFLQNRSHNSKKRTKKTFPI